jgi:tetratricopeptide (TPR) repeat protein
VRAVVVVLCLLGSGEAIASDFWESVLDPGLPRYRAAVSAGKTHLARREWGLAVVQLERASAAMPDRSEAHRLRGDALAMLERWDAAVDAWSRARTLDPLLAYDGILSFQIALAETRLGRVTDALEEYGRLVGSTGPGRRLRAVALANVAELQMSLGPERLDDAISSYRASLAEGPHIRTEWGLALALDRAGRASEAAPILERILRADPRMTSLADQDYFYYPESEKHAYSALGLEAAGDLVRADAEWEAFLGAGGDAGPWADATRAHLAAIRLRTGTARP